MKKENNKRNYQAHDKWMKNKKQGRPKQIWITATEGKETGHWEKQ